jgi:hypothetical protein
MQITPMSASASSAAVMQLGVHSTRATDLTIVTAEGDRVTISTESTRNLGFAGAVGSSDGTGIRAGALQLSGTDDVKISVEGNLSHAELVDLQKVIKAFQRAAARGDASQFLERLKRSDLDTISSVSGSVRWQTDASQTVLTGAPSPAASQ